MDRSSSVESGERDGHGRGGVLGAYELCRATRFDTFRDSLNGVFYPAKVEPTGNDRDLDRSLLSAARLPGTAAVFTPQEHTLLPRWSADAGQLCIKIRRRSLESELETMLGHPVSSWVRFPIGFDLTTPAGGVGPRSSGCC